MSRNGGTRFSPRSTCSELPQKKRRRTATDLDSLLSDIALRQPHLRNRVRGLRLQYHQVRDAIAALRHELGEGDKEVVDFADVRQRLGSVLTALLRQRARESDLIYEGYFEAFRTDLRADGEATKRDHGAQSTQQEAGPAQEV